MTLINDGLGLAVGVALSLLGMPNPILWGVMAGALLAVPMLATFKILCDHIAPLAPIGEFLGR